MTVSKKAIAALLFITLMLSFSVFVSADEITEQETLSIKTADDFLIFAENCRLDSYSQHKIVSLDADIDLRDVTFYGIPIFCGEFKGNDHTISGLDLQSHGSSIGLFRYLSQTAIVTELHISGSIVPKGTAATIGGIAGSNAGKITGCSFSGTIIGTDEVGGIAGINTATGNIEDCSVSGSISGNHFIGGITGTNNGIIQKCLNQAQINTEQTQNHVDLSDITIDTLTGVESANTVTDIGGIAGSSNGFIRFCKNEANIGYNRIGYNIGGIAGSQIGYLADCDNTGAVFGRKEVGGIVGQLEPAIAVTYSTDTLQILEGQLDSLATLATSISANLNTATSGIRNQFTIIQGQIENITDSFSSLIPDSESENPVPNMQAISNAIEEMNAMLSSIAGSLNSILNYTENAGWALERDLQAMSDTISSMQQTLGNASENLGGSVSDASDEDTDDDMTAKIERCTNTGPITADLNCGGIAGAVSIENDLDPEDDVMLFGELSLNFAGTYRAVIADCHNTASVTAKKHYIGGITGLATLGLIRACTNTGALNCPNADYVGGIAGFSDGSIRQCSVKAQITAVSYVGGIAGKTNAISDCRSMSQISAQEFTGSIAGIAQDLSLVNGNYYLPVASDIGAIDGISYQASAQPLEQESFLELENTPDFFKNFQVTFLFEDGTKKSVVLNTGKQLTKDMIPEIPAKKGYKGYWSGIKDDLCFDTSIAVTYEPLKQVMQSALMRDSGLPILLTVGSFSDTDQLMMEKLDTESNINHIEAWRISVPVDTVSIRFLPPEHVDLESTVLMLSDTGDQWHPAEYSIDGSYLVFTAEKDNFCFCIVPENNNYSGYIIAAGCALLLVICVTAFIIYRRKRAANISSAGTD